MPTSQAENTQACTIGTEHTLTTITDAGIYVLSLNLNPLAAGDIIEARAYVKVRSASTERVLYVDAWADDQPVDDEVKFFVPIPTLYSVKFTLKQTAGTGRSIEWAAIAL
jgi:hypothetical protein